MPDGSRSRTKWVMRRTLELACSTKRFVSQRSSAQMTKQWIGYLCVPEEYAGIEGRRIVLSYDKRMDDDIIVVRFEWEDHWRFELTNDEAIKLVRRCY